MAFEVINPNNWAIPVKVVVAIFIAGVSAFGYVGSQIYGFSAQQQKIIDSLDRQGQAFTWVGSRMKDFENKLDASNATAQQSRDAINAHLGSIDLTLQKHEDVLDTLVPPRRRP